MLRTPKERFLASTYSGQWGKITQGDVFEEALHAALSQLEDDMPLECAVPQQACDAHQQIIGARKFMQILSSLHMPPTTPPTTKQKGLDYSAGV